MKTLITGGSGILGTELKKFFPNSLFPSRSDLDITNNEMVFDVTMPDEIFNSLSPEEQKLGNTRTWKASDIKNNFVKIPKQMEADLLSQSGDAESGGKKSKAGDKFDLQLDIDANMEIIGNDKKAASHIFQTRQTGGPSKGWDVTGGASENGKLVVGLML